MALSKKGLRSIVVVDQKFFWKFTERIVIYPDEPSKGLLIVDFGWFDVWLYVNDKENRPPDFHPQVVTPKFVSESIAFALQEGWKENRMELLFRDGVYKVKSTN